MATTRERKEAKAERLRTWGTKRQETAESLRKVDEHLRHDWAFITQPGRIPARERMNRRDEKAYELSKTGGAMKSRAAGIEDQLARAIYDDDPDAIEQLQERVAALEARLEARKAANATYRSEHKAELKTMTAFGRSQVVPFPAYSISNLGADIRRNKERLARLQVATVEGEKPRYLYSLKRAGVCRDCGRELAQGVSARWYRQAGEIACYPSCQASAPAEEPEGEEEPREEACSASAPTVKRVDIFGVVTDTYQTEGELNGWHAKQGSLF